MSSTSRMVALSLVAMFAGSAAVAGVPTASYLTQKKAQVDAQFKAEQLQQTLYSNAREVGVGENLGRDKKSSVLNYVLYGGRDVSADGKPVLVLHKIDRAKERGSLLGGGSGGDSFIISYRYTDPDEIYLQGQYLKILEFTNVSVIFVVLEGKPALNYNRTWTNPKVSLDR